MQFPTLKASLFEVQPSMNASRAFKGHIKLNNPAMLPAMNAPAFNGAPCPCPALFLPQRRYQNDLKVQARIQTQQIDSAIQLLKMQYDAIMASVQDKPHTSTTVPSTATSSQDVDHKSFAMQFELPFPEPDEDVAVACALDTAACKRKMHREFDGISITSLVDSDSCLSKTSESNLQSKKRLRAQ
jgi:hypothetical protein